MKLKKRKIKYSAIFCLCWFAVLVLLVDGVLKYRHNLLFFLKRFPFSFLYCTFAL